MTSGRCVFPFSLFFSALPLADFLCSFRSFGPLRYAKITKDPDTGRSRGSGFACFWNKADADRAVRQSELLQAESTAHPTIVSYHTPLLFTSTDTVFITAKEESVLLTFNSHPRPFFESSSESGAARPYSQCRYGCDSRRGWKAQRRQ